jgi:ABC-type transporter Mla maintaining outer membrane lipid asymmetry ATPase subunit MlaF
VGLSGVESLYPSELSGGMKKRVALARAIVKDLGAGDDEPEELIMYDEPTAGLDPVASTVIEDLIRSMHEPDAASSLASSDDGGGGAVAAAGAANGAAAGAANGAGGGGEAHGRRRPATGGITSYVVVTHQHSTIRRAVDRIIFLHAGVVVWEGSVAEFDATEEPIVRQFASGSLQGPIVYL